ncbi:MAG: PAS domain S-box protein [Geobacteraceae bacterium]|nr:PAS domain S-box protein [Geobacteraceae bacterium]
MFKLCCKSIRTQIVLLILLMTCLPLGIIVSDAVRQYDHDKHDAMAVASSMANHIQNEQQTLLAETGQLIAALTNIPTVRQHDSAAANLFLTELIKTNSNYADIFILDASGKLWASAKSSKPGLSYADRRYFKNARASGKVSSGGFVDVKEQKVPAIALGYPVTNRSGAVTDVCVVVLSLNRYRHLFEENYASPMSSIFLVDHEGTILYSSINSKLAGKQDRRHIFKQMAQGPDKGSIEGNGDLGISRIFAYRKLWLPGESSPYMYIRTGLSREYMIRNVYHDLTINVGMLLSVMLMVLGLAIYISRRGILDKVATLRDVTHQISQGDLGITYPNPASTNELDQLGCSFMAMALQLQQADRALQQSVNNYRELVENANSVILKWDINGNILFYNAYAESIFGFSPDEVLGRNVMGTIVPDTESSGRNLTDMIHNIAIAPDKYINNENENICKNGEHVWISWNNRALTGADGNKLGILSIGQNITARKKIEQELTRSEERFRSFVENANDIVFALTPEGVFSYVSPRWKDVFGYEISETVGQPFFPFVHPDDVHNCFEFLQKVLTTGSKQSGVEYRVRCKDGCYLWYTANGSLIQDPDNDSTTFIGIGRDITERKKTEETLRLSEEKFSAAFHASPDAIILSRLSDGSYLEVNEGFTAISGYAPEEALGRTSNELHLWIDPEQRLRLLEEVKEHGIAKDVEVRLRRKDGAMILGQISARVIEIKGEQYILSITRDITEREQIQRELLKAQKLESISVLAGGIAHNFNNVLTGVIGYISYAKKHLNDTGKVLHILESAEKSSYRAAALARQLLTFSQGSIPVRKPVPVDALVQESVSLFLSGTNVRGVIDCSSHQTIHVDSQQINQAFNNIVLNALQAMPNGGILTVRADAVTLKTGNKYALQPATYVRIVFEDTGHGIRNEDLGKIFDPYFTTKEYGTGLGLSTTHSIVSKHDGSIDISSVADQGTAVTILLPSASAEPHANDESSNRLVGNDRAGHVSVLVMDDEELIREFAAEILRDMGYEVTTCCNGEEAIALFKASMDAHRPYAIVIMDLIIPGGMGGIETARHILNLAPHVRLIASSGFPNDPAIAEYNTHGFCGAMTKPYNVAEMKRVLQSVLPAGPAMDKFNS